MTALPPATDFTGASVTEGQFKTALTSLRTYLAEVLGATGGGQADPQSGTVFRRNALINCAFEIWNDTTASSSCPAGSRTAAAECWYINPTGAAVTRALSSTVRTGAWTRFSLEVVGASSVTTVLIGQRLEAASIAKIARTVTFQCYVYNGSGAAFQPSLLLGTPGAADDFTTVTNRLTQTLQSCADASWTLVSHTVDISGYTNIANGLQVELRIPSGSLVSGDTVRIAEPMLCPGAVTSTFDVQSIPEVQLACERFFETVFYGSYWLNGVGTGVVAMYGPMNQYKTKKRITPVITLPSSTNQGYNTSGGLVTPTTFTTHISNADGFNLSLALAGGIAGYVGSTATANARLF